MSQDPPTNHEQRIAELQDLLISAHAIAVRHGSSTAWERFAARLRGAGIGTITAKTFRVLEGDVPTQAIDLVAALNQRYFELTADDTAVPFTYLADGNSESIDYFGVSLWDADNDREYEADGDTEVPLVATVRRLLRDRCAKLAAVDPEMLFAELT